MRTSGLILVLASFTTIAASPALAFNWGFARVPDWMDGWLLLLLILQAPFWLVALRHKQPGQSLMTMDKSSLPPFARISIYVVITLFAALMMMFFIGMGLARM